MVQVLYRYAVETLLICCLIPSQISHTIFM